MIDASVVTWSALEVIVPQTGPLVSKHRLGLGAAEPPHITLLYPFLSPNQLDDVVSARLATLFAAFPSFAYELSSVGWFRNEVMWLAPEPSAPFAELTQRLIAEFGILPYQGQYGQITPHLTVVEGDQEEGIKAAETITPALPIEAVATHVHLVTGSEVPGSTVIEVFELAQSEGSGQAPSET